MRSPLPRPAASGAASLAACCVVVGTALAGAEARGAEPAPPPGPTVPVRLSLPAPGGCPTRAQVAGALQAALPSVRLVDPTSTAPADAAAVEALVIDLGARFLVTTGGARREVTDAARRCEERARTAAIFIVLTLDVPTMEMPAPAPPEPPPPPPPPREEPPPVTGPPPTPPPPRLPAILALEIAGLARAAPRSPSGWLPSGGSMLRLVAGRHRFPLAFSAGLALASVDPGLIPGQRTGPLAPALDVGLRAVWRRPSLSLGGEVGLGASLLSVHLQATEGGAVATRSDDILEAMVRVGARAGWRPVRGHELFLALEAQLVPWPVQVHLSRTSLWTGPPLWLAVQLGVAVDFLKSGGGL